MHGNENKRDEEIWWNYYKEANKSGLAISSNIDLNQIDVSTKSGWYN